MSTLPAQTQPGRLLSISFISLCLLLSLCLLQITGFWGNKAIAQNTAVSNNDNLHFSQQARLGFHSGDDWEPSIASDRFGHIYAMYKHYDVSGVQTCTSCNLRMLFQRSSDGGHMQVGYNLPYGDYFQMTVDQENQTQIAWGEGPNYAGPGNQWTSHSLDD